MRNVVIAFLVAALVIFGYLILDTWQNAWQSLQLQYKAASNQADPETLFFVVSVVMFLAAAGLFLSILRGKVFTNKK